MPEELNITASELQQGADTGGGMAFALLAGRLVATVVSKRTGDHVTVQARCKAKIEGKWTRVPFDEATHVFLDVPSEGGYNDKIGTYYPTGRQAGKLWADSAADPARLWAARFVLTAAAGRAISTKADVLQGERCLCCGRELTDPVSIERNIGPECYKATTGSHHQVKTPPAARTGPLPPSEPRTRPPAPVAASESGSGPQDAPEGLFTYGPGRSALDMLRDLDQRDDRAPDGAARWHDGNDTDDIGQSAEAAVVL